MGLRGNWRRCPECSDEIIRQVVYAGAAGAGSVRVEREFGDTTINGGLQDFDFSADGFDGCGRRGFDGLWERERG